MANAIVPPTSITNRLVSNFIYSEPENRVCRRT